MYSKKHADDENLILCLSVTYWVRWVNNDNYLSFFQILLSHRTNLDRSAWCCVLFCFVLLPKHSSSSNFLCSYFYCPKGQLVMPLRSPVQSVMWHYTDRFFFSFLLILMRKIYPSFLSDHCTFISLTKRSSSFSFF